MEKCHEYFVCKQKNCVVYKNDLDTQCWGIPDTLCHNNGLSKFTEMGIYKCEYCIYYKKCMNKD